MATQAEHRVPSLCLEILLHVALGTMIFAVIATGAVYLDRYVHFIANEDTNPIIMHILKGAEYLLLIADLILFGGFLKWAISDFLRKLPRSDNSND